MRLGKQVIRSLPWQWKDPNTAVQQSLRQKFIAAQQFCKLFTPFYKTYWQNLPINQTAWNAVNSYTIKNSMVLNSGIWCVNKSLFRLSNGNLLNTTAHEPSNNGSHLLYSCFHDNSGIGNALPNDLAIGVVYCEDLNLVSFKQYSYYDRSCGVAYCFTPDSFSGHICFFWLVFSRPDLSLVSNSVFCGSVLKS